MAEGTFPPPVSQDFPTLPPQPAPGAATMPGIPYPAPEPVLSWLSRHFSTGPQLEPAAPSTPTSLYSTAESVPNDSLYSTAESALSGHPSPLPTPLQNGDLQANGAALGGTLNGEIEKHEHKVHLLSLHEQFIGWRVKRRMRHILPKRKAGYEMEIGYLQRKMNYGNNKISSYQHLAYVRAWKGKSQVSYEKKDSVVNAIEAATQAIVNKDDQRCVWEDGGTYGVICLSKKWACDGDDSEKGVRINCFDALVELKSTLVHSGYGAGPRPVWF